MFMMHNLECLKEEEKNGLHTYMQIDGDIWNYEKYDADDNFDDHEYL